MSGDTNGLLRWALGITIGVILGTSGGTIYSSARISKVEERLEAKIESDYNVTLAIAERLVRIETKLDQALEGE